MNSFSDEIKKMEFFRDYGPVSQKQIDEAMEKLQVVFADDFVEYLKEHGVASFGGHEFVGICDAKRLNVVDATIYARSISREDIANLYVIEQTNYDGRIIWQSSNGEIYESINGEKPVKICGSLLEYVANGT